MFLIFFAKSEAGVHIEFLLYNDKECTQPTIVSAGKARADCKKCPMLAIETLEQHH